MRQYGVCGGPEAAIAAAEAGFDYFEWTVGGLLKPREDDDAFAAALSAARAVALPCPVVNCFVPGDLKITGPAADLTALEQYVTTAFVRAQVAGIDTIVFGSGGARRIPDGVDRQSAHQQIVAFCRMAAPIALAHGVTIVLEPLNLAECNVLTTVGESAQLVREVDHPAFRLLVDAYHLLKDDDSVESIAANGDILAHVHIATVPSRLSPAAEGCDFRPCFDALARARYAGRISIEAKIPDPPSDLPGALSSMKQLSDETATGT